MSDYFLLALLAALHGLLIYAEARTVRRRGELSVLSLALLSFVLHYDFGLILELLTPASEPHFRVLGLVRSDPGAALWAWLFLIAGPWMLYAGYQLTSRIKDAPIGPVNFSVPSRSFRRRQLVCWGLLSAYAIWVAGKGVSYVLTGAPLWIVRSEVAAEWGVGIVLLYLPLHFLALFLGRQDSQTRAGLLFSAFLGVCAICALLPIGQRTNLLLPPLMLVLFWRRPSLRRVTLGASALLICAALVLPVFKWQYGNNENKPVTELLTRTLVDDVARSETVAYSAQLCPVAGTSLLPYPMSGYVYSLFFFIPRSVVPWKGVATATYVTADMYNEVLERTEWAVGLGPIEEIAVNAGLLFVLPGLILYGVAFGLADLWTRKKRELQSPVILAALWLCGYNLPALELTFGVMLVVVAAGGVMLGRPKASRHRREQGEFVRRCEREDRAWRGRRPVGITEP